MALTPPEFYLVDYRGPLALPNPPNDDAVKMLVGDVKDPDPGEALLDVGNTPKVGVGKVHVFREALELLGNPYTTETTLKF